jgi:hypothetical protein
MMTQTENPLLTYLKYFRSTYGVQAVLVEEKLQSELPEKTSLKAKKVYWKKPQDLLSDKTKNIFIIQNLFEDREVSLSQPEHWDVFKKMVSSLDLSLAEIEVWETNEEELQEVFHFLLSHVDKEKIFLMLDKPSLEKNIYTFNFIFFISNKIITQ